MLLSSSEKTSLEPVMWLLAPESRYHLFSAAPPTDPRWTSARDSSRSMLCFGSSAATAATSSVSGSTSCNAQNVAISSVVGSSSSASARKRRAAADSVQQHGGCPRLSMRCVAGASPSNLGSSTSMNGAPRLSTSLAGAGGKRNGDRLVADTS